LPGALETARLRLDISKIFHPFPRWTTVYSRTGQADAARHDLEDVGKIRR
jgi:hypothetical protein